MMMPIGDDSYPYAFEFFDGDRSVVVGMNRTFVREVLGCDGDRAKQQTCVDENRAKLIEEALEHRSSWLSFHDGRSWCMLGLNGHSEYDKDKTFAHFGWSYSASRMPTGGNR